MISVTVNDAKDDLDAPADMPLLWVIRDELGMTETKFGCGVAQSGACTVHVDGEATPTRVLPVSAVVGKQVPSAQEISTIS
jgi:isoquinoline 1-oxidoreductase alpha subunit